MATPGKKGNKNKRTENRKEEECGTKQIRKHRYNLSGSKHKGYSQHLQSLDPSKSSAKDLSLPTQETEIHQAHFNVQLVRTQRGRDLMLVL